MKEVQEARRIKMLHQPSKVCAGTLVKISFLMEHSSRKINLLHFLCNLVKFLLT
jgi:hypothetical protein